MLNYRILTIALSILLFTACGDSGTNNKGNSTGNLDTNTSTQSDSATSHSDIRSSLSSLRASSVSTTTSSADASQRSSSSGIEQEISSEVSTELSQSVSSESVITAISSQLSLVSSSSLQSTPTNSTTSSNVSSAANSENFLYSSSNQAHSISSINSSVESSSVQSDNSSQSSDANSEQSSEQSSLASSVSSADSSISEQAPVSSSQSSSESTIGEDQSSSQTVSSESSTTDSLSLQQRVEQHILQEVCAVCHTPNSLASSTNLIFHQSSSYLQSNVDALLEFINSSPSANETLLDKTLGQLSHGGGKIFDEQSDDYQDLKELVSQLSPTDLNVPQTADQDLALEPVEKSLRRASLVLANRLPTNEELNLAKSGEDGFKNALYSIMQGKGFHSFLIDYSNRRLLTDAFFEELQLEVLNRRIKYYPSIVNKKNQAYKLGKESIREYTLWEKKLSYGLTRAPLELIAYVVENDLPYSNILTADFSMVNPQVNEAFNAGAKFEEDNHLLFKPGKHQGQTLLNAVYQSGQDADNLLYISSFDWVANYPHSGILSEPAFLNRYASTFTNKNRARSRWTYFHFLGLDVERLTQNTSLSETDSPIDNPTLNDPNCSVCHRILDPLAGSFQHFDDYGVFKSAEGGKNSLPSSYTNYSPLYSEGDTWYKDMRMPGFEDITFGSNEDTLKSAANLIVKDKRFASAAIKFWWPAIMGTEFPSDLSSASISSSNVNTQDKLNWVSELEAGFRNGFNDSSPENIKDLFVHMLSSKWFRLAKTPSFFGEIKHEIHEEAKHRLLSPTQYESKSHSLTGNYWPSNKDRSILSRGVGALSNEFRIPFGDQDSTRISKPLSYSSSLTYNTVMANALRIACDTVVTEFEQAKKDRVNFREISRFTTPNTVFEDSYLLTSQAAPQSAVYQAVMESPLTFTSLLIGHESSLALGNRAPFWVSRIQLKNSTTGAVTEIDNEYFTNTFNAGIQDGNVLIEDGLYLNLFANSDEKGWFITSNRLFIPLPEGQYDSIAIIIGSNNITDPAELTIQLMDSNQSERTAGEKAIRNVLANLHRRYWGTNATDLKTEIDQSYNLFNALLTVSGKNSEDKAFFNSCLNSKQINGIQIYDTDGTLEVWASMLIYFLTDYRFLHE